MPTTTAAGIRVPLDSDPVADTALAIRNAVADLEAGWTNYNPTWANSGATQPAIGNGTILGRYKRIGKTVLFRVVITMGTTTTYGTAGGAFSVSLPFAAHGTGRQIVSAGDAAIGSAYSVRGRIEAGSSTIALWTPGTAAGGGDRTVTPSTPAAWTSGSVLVIQGSYEAA